MSKNKNWETMPIPEQSETQTQSPVPEAANPSGLVVPAKREFVRFRPEEVKALNKISDLLRALTPRGRKWVMESLNFFAEEEPCPETQTG